MWRFRHSLLLASLVTGAACGGDDGGGPVVPPPENAAFEAAGGSGQSAIAGTTLPVPYTVRLRDDAGQPVAGATVRWSLDGGTGSLSTASSVTDAAGLASVRHTLGPLTGIQAVSAALSGSTIAPVVFGTTALAAGAAVRVAEIPVPPDYGIHDTFVREGLAFVCAWNTGVIIYDVGHGISGGSPSAPVEVSRVLPPIGTVSAMMGAIHNAWWFHNPVRNEKRYLFLGQEGPGVIGSEARGDIYVVDVSDLRHPAVVATFGRAGEGTHNFWMDEPAQVLYAAYYNGGVVAINVSGTLSGDLSGRQIAQVRPGGGDSTYTWGVQVANGFVYASDMETGLWQLSKAAMGLVVLGGGRNVLERWTSDLWVSGRYAFTGTWGGVARRDSLGQLHGGDALKVWTLMPPGEPLLTDSLILDGVGTVSDVEVSADGQRLLLTTERGTTNGLAIYSLANPGHPTPVTFVAETPGLHTGTFTSIGGRDFVFAARNPGDPALVVYDVTEALH